MKKHHAKKIVLLFVLILFSASVVFYFYSFTLYDKLTKEYTKLQSVIITDRDNKEICIKPNAYGNYMRASSDFSEELEKFFVQKEDKYFYYHLGINPISIIQATLGYLEFGKRKASSTITQQLSKILLHTESQRNIKNKFKEILYAISLELHNSKKEILEMYLNSIFFSHFAQGVNEASMVYFNSFPQALSRGQIIQLLSTISSPNENNPGQKLNINESQKQIKNLKINDENIHFSPLEEVRKNIEQYAHNQNPCFEYSTFPNAFEYSKKVTLDSSLTEKIRGIANDVIFGIRYKNANNAAIIVISLPENEILALVGSLDPSSSREGDKINMAIEPRAIGSTIKPFIYLKAFEKNLRPYTLVDDREYKYITALGFPLYPKNYDWKYRGEVTLHYALSNSLNVPAVKVLEYAGLKNFYSFLQNDLKFIPIQPLESYQLGIALGALEMNLFDLASYFTIFPNNGILRETKIDFSNAVNSEKKIANHEHIELINKILNDRITGMDQFGMISNLNLFQNNYALKTGTSRDYRDSWIIGFTPDFLVGVWVGNADVSPMDEVSGQLGAGKIWAKTMELLMNSKYNKKTPFTFESLKEFQDNDSIQYGLAGDNYEKYKNILKIADTSLILLPHDGDTFMLEENTKIILWAKEDVQWYINDQAFGEGIEKIFPPAKAGQYLINAKAAQGKNENITINIQ